MSSTAKEARNLINAQIRAPRLRLIAEDGQQMGVVSLTEAREAAESAGLDLVLISPNADPPVARMMNYGKFLFETGKQQTKQKRIKVKELKFRPGTDKADYDVKLRKIRQFLEEGDKVKVTVFFRGREIAHHDLGMRLLERIREELAEEAKVEFFPKGVEGRQLVMVLCAKKK